MEEPIKLTAVFDQIGKFADREGNEHEATHAHYIIVNQKGEVSSHLCITGGLYLPKDTILPDEGILVLIRKTHET